MDLDFTPYYSLVLPVSKQKVQYRPYLVGEEIKFLTHLESESIVDLINAILNLTKDCVKEKNTFDNMNLVDFTYLTAQIRAKSKGEEVNVSKECPSCKNKIHSKFDIIKDLKIKNDKNVSIVIDITDDIKIEIGILSYTHLLDIIELETKDESAEAELLTIASCIKKVIHKGKIYSNLTVDVIYEDVIKKLTATDLKKIAEEMKKLPIIYGILKFECNCGYVEEIEVDNILNFLS